MIVDLNNCPLCIKNILHEHFFQKHVTFYKYDNFEQCLKEHSKGHRIARKYDSGKVEKKSKKKLYEEAKHLFDEDRNINKGKIVCKLLTIDGRKINTEEIEGFIKFIL